MGSHYKNPGGIFVRLLNDDTYREIAEYYDEHPEKSLAEIAVKYNLRTDADVSYIAKHMGIPLRQGGKRNRRGGSHGRIRTEPLDLECASKQLAREWVNKKLGPADPRGIEVLLPATSNAEVIMRLGQGVIPARLILVDREAQVLDEFRLKYGPGGFKYIAGDVKDVKTDKPVTRAHLDLCTNWLGAVKVLEKFSSNLCEGSRLAVTFQSGRGPGGFSSSAAILDEIENRAYLAVSRGSRHRVNFPERYVYTNSARGIGMMTLYFKVSEGEEHGNVEVISLH